jgi:O-acetyl-ADP-ribose deacetylase (regulator of RNase III)
MSTEVEKKIVILQGDLTEQECDAIVNVANNRLWMGGGVAGAIKRKGGEEIEREAVSKGPIPIGEAITTKAGKLKARYVIHAATMGSDFKTSAEIIEKATLNSLKLTEELRLESIAFPALGTGVGGFPVAECAKIMLDTARKFLQNAKQIKEVRMVLFDIESYKIFQEKFTELSEK